MPLHVLGLLRLVADADRLPSVASRRAHIHARLNGSRERRLDADRAVHVDVEGPADAVFDDNRRGHEQFGERFRVGVDDRGRFHRRTWGGELAARTNDVRAVLPAPRSVRRMVVAAGPGRELALLVPPRLTGDVPFVVGGDRAELDDLALVHQGREAAGASEVVRLLVSLLQPLPEDLAVGRVGRAVVLRLGTREGAVAVGVRDAQRNQVGVVRRLVERVAGGDGGRQGDGPDEGQDERRHRGVLHVVSPSPKALARGVRTFLNEKRLNQRILAESVESQLTRYSGQYHITAEAFCQGPFQLYSTACYRPIFFYF